MAIAKSCPNTDIHASHDWVEREHPEAPRDQAGPLVNYCCLGVAGATAYPVKRGLFSRYLHRTYHLDKIGDSGDPANQREGLSHPFAESNIVTSEVTDPRIKDGYHTIAIDLDVPAVLIQSSTPGNSHLYIDVPMPWEKYEAVLLALANAGVLQEGYVGASICRKHTSLRMPWVHKGDDYSNPPASELTALDDQPPF